MVMVVVLVVAHHQDLCQMAQLNIAAPVVAVKAKVAHQ